MKRFLPGLFLIIALVLAGCSDIGSIVTPTATATPIPTECMPIIVAQPLSKANVEDTFPEPYNGFAVKIGKKADRDICAMWLSPKAVSCPSNDATYSAWVGYISAKGDIVQIGEEYLCTTRSWHFWYELGDKKTVFSDIIPRPGGSNTAYVHYDAKSSKYTLYINGKNYSGGVRDAPNMALVVIEAEFTPHGLNGSTQSALANFGSVQFSTFFDRQPLLASSVFLYATPHAKETVSRTDTFKSTFVG